MFCYYRIGIGVELINLFGSGAQGARLTDESIDCFRDLDLHEIGRVDVAVRPEHYELFWQKLVVFAQNNRSLVGIKD